LSVCKRFLFSSLSGLFSCNLLNVTVNLMITVHRKGVREACDAPNSRVRLTECKELQTAGLFLTESIQHHSGSATILNLSPRGKFLWRVANHDHASTLCLQGELTCKHCFLNRCHDVPVTTSSSLSFELYSLVCFSTFREYL
jgi:hypothetical protein